MQKNKYYFLPAYSLSPNSCITYNKVFIRDFDKGILKSINEFKIKRTKKNSNSKSLKNLKDNTHNFKISDSAKKNLKNKINWLYYLAKSKRVKTYSGKEIYNFKIGFITLTLPSKQKDPTKFITNNLFNQFLTEIRQRTKMENYVWRLEFQKNKNVHYHIVTDTYIDYHLVLKIWNRILDNYGYIKPYTEKHNKLSLRDYNSMYNSDNKIAFEVMAKRYAKGKKEKWSNPPSVDCKSVITNKSIAFYISKYFNKEDKNNPICNDLDTFENSTNLRLWFCSRSLSKLNKVSGFCDELQEDIFSLVHSIKDKICISLKYAFCMYFDLSQANSRVKKILSKIFRNYASEREYIPWSC